MMPPLLTPELQLEWLRHSKEFARACEDGELSQANATAATLVGLIHKACDPAVMIDVHQQVVRYCEMELRNRAERQTATLNLNSDDEL